MASLARVERAVFRPPRIWRESEEIQVSPGLEAGSGPAVPEDWDRSQLEIAEITLPQLRGLLRRMLLRSLLASASAGHIVSVLLEDDDQCEPEAM